MHKIDIIFKPSKIFLTILILVICCSFAIVFALPPFPFKKTVLFTVILTYGFFICWEYVLMQGNAIMRLTYDNDGWRLQDRIRTSKAALCGETTITRFLSILRFKLPGHPKKRTCLVFKDALGNERYRQLITLLRTSEMDKADDT